MPTPIDSLELEIQSSSNAAASGIEALSATLEKLKNATKGGMGLVSVKKQLSDLDTALKNVDGSAADKIDKLASALSKLSGLGQIKISPSIGNQLKNIGTATAALSGTDFSGISRLSTALAPINNLGRSSGLQSTITQLQRLPQLAQTFNTINWGRFTQQIQQMSNALAPLANQLNAVSTAFSRMPQNIQRVVAATNRLPAANNAAAGSYINLYAKLKMAIGGFKKIYQSMASWIHNANTYIEDINLFNASMGKFVGEARDYAENVSEILGIDPGEWMRNQGVFMTLAKGFGVASDRAYTMSKNLTQLGYDMSSFFNISVEDSMQKIQSAFSGELEPVRRLGYDLSQAALKGIAMNIDDYVGSMDNLANAMSDTSLESFALSQGITKAFNEMTQAEKSQLRYIALMKQVTVVQGDMARTLDAPANQLRVLQAQVTQCARALGEVFIPVLNEILPYVIALVKVFRLLAEIVASLMNFELPEVDYGNISAGADAMSDLVDNTEDETKAAKKLKNLISGIDELNIISPSDSDSDAMGGFGDFNFELPDYDFLNKAVQSRADEIVEKMKEWLGITEDINSWSDLFDTNLGEILATVGAIGAGFAAWKISKGLLTVIEKLKTLLTGLTAGNLIGAIELYRDLDNFKKYFEDYLQNGPTFDNVTGMLAEFAGILGDVFLLFGNVKVGGALKGVQGVGKIAMAIKDMSENGINWDNVSTLLDGISDVGICIGALTGHWEVAFFSLALQGILDVIDQVQEIQEAIETGDWSGVDETKLIIGLLEAIVGVVVGVGLIVSKKRAASSAGDIQPTLTEVGDTMTTTSDTLNGGGGLFEKLKTIAKDLAMGLVILVEVAAAVLLFVGAIILLGMELEQVGIAWQPVLQQADVVLIALGMGVVMFGAIGVAVDLLGSKGGTEMIVNMALGTAILVEMGAATLLFIAEIWAIGKALDEVGQAWQPVLDNGETIAAAIGLGTALLVAIGVVTAALGMATVESAGMLPLAIGLGTAILVEMGAATLLFIAEIWAIGKGLDEVGEAWQPVLDNSATIEQGIAKGTELLIAIGVVTAALGAATVASAGLLPLAIGLGTALLIELSEALKLFITELGTVADKLSDDLAPPLDRLNSKLPNLSTNMSKFVDFMTTFAGHVVRYTEVSAISGLAATIDTIIGWFTQDPIDKLANDVGKISTQTQNLNSKLDIAVPELEKASGLLQKYQQFLSELETLTNCNVNLSNGSFVNMNDVGKNIVTGFVDGIKSKSGDFQNAAKELVEGFKNSLTQSADNSESAVTTWASNIKSWFTDSSNGAINKTTFEGYAKDIITAFMNSVSNRYSDTKNSITTWAKNVKSWFTDTSFGGVNKTTFEGYGRDAAIGFNSGISNNYSTSKTGITTWAAGIKDWFTGSGYGGINKSTFEGYGRDAAIGFNSGISNNYSTSKSGITSWAQNIKDWFTGTSNGNINSTTFSNTARDLVTGFSNGITNNYTSSQSAMTSWAANIKTWFEYPNGTNEPSLSTSFYNIGANVIQGFIDGVNSLWQTAMNEIYQFGQQVIAEGKAGTEEASPSKAFKKIGAFVIEGFNIGIDSEMSSSFKLMDKWLAGVNSFSPTVAFAVDTSALSYYKPQSLSRSINAEVVGTYRHTVTSEGYTREELKQAMLDALNESGVSENIRRQAEKKEQTIVQVGNRTVTDAVVTQQNANGYRFTS